MELEDEKEEMEVTELDLGNSLLIREGRLESLVDLWGLGVPLD